AIEATATLCESLGHAATPMATPWPSAFSDPFLLYWAGIANSVVSGWEAAAGRAATETDFEPFTLGLRDHYKTHEDEAGAAVLKLLGFVSDYDALFKEYDVLLSPVLAAPPPPIGYFGDGSDYDRSIERVRAYAQYTAPANVSGAASLSLPLGWSKAGLPIGSLFNARRDDERLLLELAYELEEAAPWRDRKPPVWVG
ncbi:MAG: amidase family protein, partial [Pseudomonadota bacterium]